MNQMTPSAPAAIRIGWLLPVGTGYSVILPSVVMRPILLPLYSVNHSALSEPTVMQTGPAFGTGYSVIFPSIVIRPILLPPNSANQIVPSGPVIRRVGPLLAFGSGNSVT